MPKFNLAPLSDDLNPVWPPASPPKATRAQMNQSLENRLGPLKPLGQLMNTLASPDTKAGIFTGPINGISKLTNALGDLVQGKPIDVKDAWTISDKQARQFNPFRIGTGSEVTAADEAGLAVGEGIGAELAGAATGATVLRRLGQLGQLKKAADAMKATQAVRRAAVAVQASPKIKAGVNVAKNVGEALVGTALAAPFLDQQDGNLANLPDNFTFDPNDTKGVPFIRAVKPARGVVDAQGNWTGEVVPAETGFRLPGRMEEGDNYLQAFGKGLMVEGIAAPLALIGAGALLAPIRRGLANGDVNWIKDLADAELEPYMPKPMAGPALPSAYGSSAPADAASAAAGFSRQQGDQLNDFAKAKAGQWSQGWDPARSPWDVGGPLAPYDSAIGRSLQEQTQIRQVTQQREWLQQQGLVEQGELGQLELNVGQAVDPEVRLQIRQLQTQRGQLIKAMQESPDQLDGIEKQLVEVDKQIADLNLTSTTDEFLAPRSGVQGEFDLVDPRPEIDTYLAHLDELDDQQLRQVHSRVYRQAGQERNVQELAQAQAQIQTINDRIAEIQSRADAGNLTPTGAKRLLTRAQKELDAAQQQVASLQARSQVPETLVGDQLEMTLPQQLGLNLADEIQLPPFRDLAATASEYGYRTPDDYRNALQGWNRDQLRRLAMPDSSPEVAALVKARTGRRVWNAKKQDIVDALVEISERRGRYLPPEPPTPEQGALRLTTNPAGGDAPLLDVPANLDVPGMSRTLDADGNEVVVPMVDYQARGIDAETRNRLKREILQRAIDNGEVQAPVTPLPKRPDGPEFFQQGQFIDDLLADESGQLPMQFLNDQLPIYKAGGKNADLLIDEMRLRYEYQVMDAQAQRVQRQAWLADRGWDQMTWEEKKKLGILGEGFYALQRNEFGGAVDRVRAATPQFNPELTPTPPRKANTYEWTPEGTAMKEPAKAPEAAAAPPVSKRQATAQATFSRGQARQLKVQQQRAAMQAKELDNEIAKLERKIAEGSCNG
jgi:hypothetical protein